MTRSLLAVAAALALAGCANPYSDPAGYQRDVDAFFGSPVGQVLRVPAAVMVYGLANSSSYSSTVDTGAATYDVRTTCAFRSCYTRVRERE